MIQYDNIIGLRAIENRRTIIKASNYGWSKVINPYGMVLEKSKDEINYFETHFVQNKTTFYSLYGKETVL